MQSLIFILLLGLVQAVLLALFFFQKRSNRQGYFFLLLYLSTIILQLAFKLISKSWLIDHLNIVYTLTYQLPFLYGPFIYLFVRTTLTKRKFRPLELLHFTPFLLVFFHFVVADPNEYPVEFISPLFDPFNRLCLQLLSLGLYHLLAVSEWINYRKSLRNKLSNIHRAQLKWILKLVGVSFSVTLLIAFTIYYMYIFFPALQPVRFGFAALTFFVYWISYTALNQPFLFSVIRGTGPEWLVSDQHPKLFIHKPTKKYANSNLSEDESLHILLGLEKKVVNGKLFIEADITIDKVAEEIGCSRHHLSQVLNEKMNKSFYDYINEFRVEEAKLLLLDPKRQDHKISSIAFDAGFNSISTFNEVFKKLSGSTPSQFRENSLSNRSGLNATGDKAGADDQVHPRKERV